MAYSTHSDLILWIDEDQLVELASSDSQASIESEDVQKVLDEVIASADAEIDSYCLNRWPDLRSKDPVPDEINKLSALIAIYYLFLRRQGVPEERRISYEDCIRKLELFSKGKITLGLDTDGNKASAGTDFYRTDASSDYTVPDDDERVYTKEKLAKM